ncbi:RNA-directed DNA polymerase from mobile element jockey [Trichonephila clavipes]|nr:RNA-directed DNA polymerase from mobile element jockey [Trichonephila clavipes]
MNFITQTLQQTILALSILTQHIGNAVSISLPPPVKSKKAKSKEQLKEELHALFEAIIDYDDEKYSPDLILVQETNLRPIHNIRIANYTCYRNDRVADGHAVGGESNFINPNQFGFTKRLSTCHPLLRLTEKITSVFQRGRSTGAVFLDIQKAFDRVWIGGLIYKLITNNFPPALIHLINSYLTNRSYQVRVKDSLSNIYKVNLGAPQGSLLGPIIFNIFINDIPTHPHTSLNIYADDIAIATTFKNHKSITKHLNNHLKLLETYFNTWKIKLNVEETVAVLFTRKRKAATPPTLYSTPLQWSQNTINLGLLLDNKLTWRQHILYTRNKFRNALRLIYPLICRDSTMTRDNKVLLYTAVLRPILSYGCPVWGYAAKSNLKTLEISQNKTIRMIVHANMYMKNTHIYEALKLPNFKSYIQKIAINFFNSLPQTNNYHIINLEKYTPNDNTKRPRRILLDSYNPP